MVLTTGGIDDMCSKYLVEAGLMGVRRVLKSDLKKIAKSSGAQLLLSMANMEGEESFDASFVGEAEEIIVERIADDDCILLKGYVEETFISRKLLFAKLCK